MGTTDEQDPYLVLGVARTATAAQIRAAYRALVAKYHPDRHQGNPLAELASAKMTELNAAYEILSDPARRRAYDSGGTDGHFRGGGPTADARATSRAARGSRPPPPRSWGRGYGKIVTVVALLPLVVRFGGLIVRGIVALLRELVEGLTLIRGTPFAAGAALLAAVFLVVVLVRRLRRAARAKQRQTSSPPD